MRYGVANSPEAWALAEAVCNDAADAEQIRQLESLLAQDENARELYVDLLSLDADLQWLMSSQHQGEAAVEKQFLPPDSLPNLHLPLPPSANRHPPSFIAGAWRGTVDFFSQEVPFAILVTIGIFAIVGLIGSQITYEHYTRFPWQSADPVARAGADSDAGHGKQAGAPETQEEELRSVARITGMVDCQWANGLGPAHDKIALGHNNKFSISSGLMEITYHTGARVILQGPCTYEIDSGAGGFLAIGKLTARIDVAKPQADNPTSNLQHPASPHPLFAVRTPTAVVADLGTEFGVEVSQDGQTESQVFAGKVRLAALDVRGEIQGREVLLGAGEMARIEKAAGSAPNIVLGGAAKSKVFVRDIREAAAAAARQVDLKRLEQLRCDPALAAYYAFDNERESPDRLLNRAPATQGRWDGVLGLDDQPDTRPFWAEGRRPGGRALRFEAARRQVVRVPYDAALNLGRELTVAVSLKPRMQAADAPLTVLSRRWGVENDELHFQLALVGPRDAEVPSSIQFFARGSTQYNSYSLACVVPERDEWLYVAAVQRADSKEFYLNGLLINSYTCESAPVDSEEPLWIGAAGAYACYYDGLIDEIWIFKRALSSAEIASLRRLADFGKPQTP